MAEPDAVGYLDCCTRPALRTVKSLYSSNHDAEALRRCDGCGAYWFYRYHEYVSFADDDDWTDWYSPLSPQEGTFILAADENPDLSFLKTRASFMQDREGVKRVPGQPDHSWG